MMNTINEIASVWQNIARIVNESAVIVVRSFAAAITATTELTKSLKEIEEMLTTARVKKYQGGFYSYMD